MKENIISIRKRDTRSASQAFAEFMQMTESFLNDKAESDPKYFASLSSSALEQLSVRSMKEICANTPFRPDEIKLVSGQSFPDIITETFYGIEVKSTQADHWTSTGSSILETTRDKNVESIYMLFGKLGGTPRVRCRPYEDCLYDITVTHSPRYLIDMNTSADETIFAKMDTTYDALRTSGDSIAQVRKYYRDKANNENKKEMPWWIAGISDVSKNNDEGMMIRHISSLSADEKRKLILQIYILFPADVISKDYITPCMWLVAYHKIVCHNMRDFMSAGGQAKFIDGKRLSTPIPAIVKNFLDYSPFVKSEIEDLRAEIDVYNPDILKKSDLFQAWVDQVDLLLNNKFGKDIHFSEWVSDGHTLSV